MVQHSRLVASTQLVAVETAGRGQRHLHLPGEQRLSGKVGDGGLACACLAVRTRPAKFHPSPAWLWSPVAKELFLESWVFT